MSDLSFDTVTITRTTIDHVDGVFRKTVIQSDGSITSYGDPKATARHWKVDNCDVRCMSSVLSGIDFAHLDPAYVIRITGLPVTYVSVESGGASKTVMNICWIDGFPDIEKLELKPTKDLVANRVVMAAANELERLAKVPRGR